MNLDPFQPWSSPKELDALEADEEFCRDCREVIISSCKGPTFWILSAVNMSTLSHDALALRTEDESWTPTGQPRNCCRINVGSPPTTQTPISDYCGGKKNKALV